MDSALLTSLKEMLHCCKEIQLLLHKDKDCFSHHQLNLIDLSNQKKVELLNKLNILVNDLHTNEKASDLWSKIAKNHQEFIPVEDVELQQLMQELKSEILTCYKYIGVNSHIVFTNLQQLKEIWDKLLACKSNDIYDNKGGAK